MNYAITIKLNDLVSNKLNKISNKLNKIKDIKINTKLEDNINLDKLNKKINDRVIKIKTILDNSTLDNIKDKIVNIKLKLLNKDKIKKEIDDIKAYSLKALSVITSLAIPLKSSMDFELQFVDVKKVANFTDKELANIKKMIFDIASKSSASVKDITKITAEGIATGKIPLKDMRDYINLANQAKVAFNVTNEQLGKAFNATLAKLNYSVKDTKKLFDMLNYSTNISSSKMTDMLNVLSRTAGNMSKLKTNQIATLINFAVEKGISPETTATSLNTIMNSLSELNDELVSKLKDKKGINIELPFNISGASAIKEGKGFEYLLAILKKIKKETNADKRYNLITSIFGKGEQKNLIENFLNDLDGLQNRLNKISLKTNWSNSVSKEFQQVEATAIKKIEKFKGILNIILIKIGTLLLGITSKILSIINPLMQKISKFISTHKKLVSIILKIVGVIGILLVSFLTFKVMMLSLSIVSSGLISSLLGVLKVISLINLPITLIGVAIYGLYKYWNEFKSAFKYAIDLSSINELINTFNIIINKLKVIWNTVTKVFLSIYNYLFNTNVKINETSSKVSIFGEVFKIVGYTIGLALNVVISLLNKFLQLINWIINKVQILSPIFKALGVYIVTALEYPLSIIKKLYGYLVSIKNKIVGIINSVKNFKLPNITDKISIKFDSLKNKLSRGWNSLKAKIGFADDKKETIKSTSINKWNVHSLSNNSNNSSVDINLNAKGVNTAEVIKKRGYINVKNINLE
jgi:TP901 family phage tail tape measure protein